MPGVRISVNQASLKQLTDNLKTLRGSQVRKLVTKAMYKGSSKITAAARRNIYEDHLEKTGALYRSVGVAGNSKVPKDQIGIKIGILGSRKGYGGMGSDRDAFYGRFLDKGTKYIRARRWLQNAGSSQAQEYVATVVTESQAGFDKVIAKLKKSP